MMDKKLILIVEDDEDIQAIYRDIIENAYDVELVQRFNGRDGIEAVKERRPDFIILDLLMPVMNGEEFLKELRGSLDEQDIPVLICSVNQTLANKLLSEKKANAVLPKLFMQEDLIDVISRLTEIKTKVS